MVLYLADAAMTTIHNTNKIAQSFPTFLFIFIDYHPFNILFEPCSQMKPEFWEAQLHFRLLTSEAPPQVSKYPPSLGRLLLLLML